MLKQILEHLDGSEYISDVADAVVVVRLRQVYDLFVHELQHLDSLRSLSSVQKEDKAALIKDVTCIQHVLNLMNYNKEELDYADS